MNLNSPTEMVIPFDSSRMFRMFIPVGIFALISLVINFDSWLELSWWEIMLFIVIGAFLFYARIILPRNHYLLLTSEGLTIHYYKAERFYGWDDVRHFRLVRGPSIGFLPTGFLVVFDLTEDYLQRHSSRMVTRKVLGYDVSFKPWFQIETDELLALLYEWQRRFSISNPS